MSRSSLTSTTHTFGSTIVARKEQVQYVLAVSVCTTHGMKNVNSYKFIENLSRDKVDVEYIYVYQQECEGGWECYTILSWVERLALSLWSVNGEINDRIDRYVINIIFFKKNRYMLRWLLIFSSHGMRRKNTTTTYIHQILLIVWVVSYLSLLVPILCAHKVLGYQAHESIVNMAYIQMCK